MSSNVPQSLIFDIGSANSRIGFNTSDQPQKVFASLTGNQKTVFSMGDNQKEKVYGNEVIDKRNILNVNHLVRGGKIHNWEEIEYL